MGEKRREVDLAGCRVNRCSLDRGDLLLAEALAHDIKSARQRSISKRPIRFTRKRGSDGTLTADDARAIENAFQARLEGCSRVADVAEPARIDTALKEKAPHPVTNRRGGPIATICTPIAKTIKKRDKAHLKFVASQPCLVCQQMPCDAHHLKFSQPRSLGSKVSDEFTVPLCRRHHQQLHQYGNELAWWANMQVAPIGIAKELWLLSRQIPSAGASSPLSRAGVAENPHD